MAEKRNKDPVFHPPHIDLQRIDRLEALLNQNVKQRPASDANGIGSFRFHAQAQRPAAASVSLIGYQEGAALRVAQCKVEHLNRNAGVRINVEPQPAKILRLRLEGEDFRLFSGAGSHIERKQSDIRSDIDE